MKITTPPILATTLTSLPLTTTDITAGILAGGKGRRMEHKDKGLVTYLDKPLIEHVLERIRPQVGTVVINANRNHAVYGAYGHPVLSDDLADWQGPLAGFAVLMEQSTTPYVLILPCDGPFVPQDYVARMMAQITQAKQLVVAHDGQRMQPVHALISTDLLDSLKQYLDTGDRKIDRWYTTLDFALADFADTPEIFDNFNTKQQLQTKERT